MPHLCSQSRQPPRRWGGTTSFRDDMENHPITSNAWSFYQIRAPVVSEARDIEFGMQLVGTGTAWIDNISMTFSPGPGDDDVVRNLIRTFADSRNAHDGKAAAQTYVQDGEYIGLNGSRIRGTTDLAALWGGVTGKVRRTIDSVNIMTPNIAVVHVTANDGSRPYLPLNETFVVVRGDDGEWKIRVHEAVR